jgi:hypothetical protein
VLPPAVPPPLGGPGLGALVGLAVVRVGLVEVGRELDVGVRPHAVGLPHLLSGIDVVGRHPATDAELAAGDADDELVLHHQAGHRHRLAAERVRVLGLPQLLAGIGVDAR